MAARSGIVSLAVAAALAVLLPAAVFRSGDDPPSFEYRSEVFRPPAS